MLLQIYSLLTGGSGRKFGKYSVFDRRFWPKIRETSVLAGGSGQKFWEITTRNEVLAKFSGKLVTREKIRKKSWPGTESWPNFSGKLVIIPLWLRKL